MATATISPGDEVWTPDSDIPPPPGYTPQAEVWTPAHSAKEGIPPPPGYDTKEKRQDELWSEYSNRWDLLHGPKIDKEYADFHTLDAGDVAQRKADDKTVWKKRYEANSGKLPLGLIISSEPDTLPKAESFVRDLATKTDRADSFNIASTGKLFNESGIEGQFEKATGQKWNEDWSRKYQTLAEAFEKAKPLVKPGALPAADVAAGTRQDLRPDVLLATHALARDQKLGANEGFLDRARQEFYGGLAAIPTAMKTEAETPDQRRYDLALQQARQEGGNVKEPKFWSPEGLSLGAIGLVPAIASGGATSMAQRQTSTRDYLLQQGVSDAAAKTGDAVASLGEWFFLFGAGPKTVLKPFGALLKTDAGKAVEQAGLNLIEKLGGQSAFRKKLLSASAKYLGETAVTSGYVGAASGGYPAFVEEMTKWAAGKNPDAGRVLSETLTAAEHMAPLGAVLHAPELFGNIVKRIDGGGPGPSRSEAEKLGMPAPIADRIESRLAWIESHRPDLLKPPEGAQPEGVVENGKTAETEVNPPTKEVVNEGRDEEGKGVLTPTAQTPGGAEEAPPANPFKAIPIKPAAPEKPAEPPPAAKPPEEIGIKNAYTEQRREEEGLPERQLPEHRAWEESRQKVEQLPHEDVTRIVDDIRGRDLTKEPVNEYEGWVLGRRTTEVENRLMAARESGDKKATQAAQQELADVLALDERAGTEPARTLAARRAMWDKDFSLVGITRQWIKAKRGPLSEAEWNAAGKLADDVKKAEAGDALADKETTTAVEKIEQQAKGEVPAKVEARFKKFMDIVDQWWNPKVDAARGRLRQYFSAGGKHGALPIDVLPDLAIIGADYIKKGAATLAAFTARLVDEFGEHIREHAREVWDSIDKELDKHEKDLQAHLAGPADTKKPLTSKKPPETKLKEIIKESGKRTAEAKEKSPEAIQEKIDKRFEKDGAITSEMVRELAKAIIKGGTHGVEPVSKAVHDVLLEVDPDISRKESNDLLSGRGQVRLPSKDPVDRELTDIKRQRALIDNIEGLQQNPPEVPQGTGFKRQEPSDTERRLRQKFNEEKKRHPELQAKTPEQLKGAQQAREKAMTNWLNDRYKEIETREKIVKERKPLDMTERLKALQEEKDRVKAIWDETFPEQPRSTEQRQADTLRGIERAANALEADLKAGRLSGKVKGEVPTTAEIDAARAKLQHLKDLREEARASDPKYQADQDARQLATYKRILSSREADLLQQKADMERTGMAPDKAKGGLKTKLDSAAKTQQRRVAKLKQEVKETADSLRANMVEKVGSFLGSVVHGNVFSSLGVASHIGGAIAWKIPGMIVDELSRSLLSRIPGFTEFAGPLEGRGDLPTYAKELFNLKQTGRNMADQVLHGGTLSQTESGEAHPRPVWAVPKPGASVGVKRALRVAENITEGPGRLHAAGKEIERSPAEATARAKMLADAKEHGENVNDPEVKGRIGKVAVEWANRQILQQKTTGDALQRRWTARPDPTTGHKTVKGLAKEIWGHGIQPVFRIGMNFAAEMLERMFGPLAGFTELAWHRVVHGELMKMPAEAREAIARKMVYGVSAIPAMALLGWYNYKSFGGYYMGTQRPKDQKLEPGEVEIAGEKIPEEFTYNPLLSVMQAVAQVRYLIEDYDKHGMSKHGFWSAAAETGSVILERTPLGSESRVMSDLSQPERVEHALGQILKTMVIPGMIAWYAKHTDTQPRDTRGFLGPIKGAIPGFREDLPVKKGKP